MIDYSDYTWSHDTNGVTFHIKPEHIDVFSPEFRQKILNHGTCQSCGKNFQSIPSWTSHGCESYYPLNITLLYEHIGDEYNKVLNKEGRRFAQKRSTQVRKENAIFCAGIHTIDDVKSIFLLQNGMCHFCGAELPERGYHRDHLTPVAELGSEWPSNIALTCKDCNQRKGRMTEAQFWQKLKKDYGPEWVATRKARRDMLKREREKLTRARKRAVNLEVKEFSRALDAIVPGFAEVKLMEDGILLELGEVDIWVAPHSHRLVGKWGKADQRELVAALQRVCELLGR